MTWFRKRIGFGVSQCLEAQPGASVFIATLRMSSNCPSQDLTQIRWMWLSRFIRRSD